MTSRQCSDKGVALAYPFQALDSEDKTRQGRETHDIDTILSRSN